MKDKRKAGPQTSEMPEMEDLLRRFALEYPGAYEEFPWGERAFKVNKKAFVFMHATSDSLSISVKLPSSRDMAVDLPFAEPTHYGLGQHGWVTAHFHGGSEVATDLIKAWIEESYRAIAPKKLIALIEPKDAPPAPAETETAPPPARKRARRPAKKK